jgi:hypothetical protein
MSDAYANFERDIPEHLREDAMTAMAEATGKWGKPSNVTILDHDRIDAINCRAHGIIEIEGEEYTFQMEDGNWNGTVLLAWNEDKEFKHHAPTVWALQPQRHLIDKAVMSNGGPFLLMKWDAILKNNAELAAIPGKYSYDRYVQPGSKTEGYWKAKAAAHLFDLVTDDIAKETRRQLGEAKALTS